MSQIQTSIWAFVTRARAFESEILIALVVLVVSYFLLNAWREWRYLPPGPYGLPIVGYLPFLSDPLWDFHKLGEKYGDVFSVKLGSATVVCVHGVEAIKEALARSEFLGRPLSGVLKLFFENSAFFRNDVHKWREQRRFVVQSMKDLGLGKTQIEGEIMDEIHHFLDQLRVHNGAPMDLKDPLSPSMSNNICTLVFGKRYETAITKHRDTFDPKNIRDFIDRFIDEQNFKQEKDPNTTFNDDTLVSNVLDLFTAGSETVRTSIMFCVYVAAAFPQHQEKVKEEILEVMGPDRAPEYQDLKNMPFTHSFMLEVMRWKTVLPLNIPHCTLSDTTICGYHIPKNVTVLFNLWNAHHHPNYWTEPESFIPDRFITKDGQSVSRPPHFMPFSAGKRVCPGEPMAIMEMFLYLTSILQKFQVVFPDGYMPTFKAATKGTYRLDPYKVRFLARS
ncbi:hypothetical protein JTE90_006478 [Oedothorax gibbosus]|uniref:Cytochrome P450 n=1 Tax=Oedothorax gibbosus TaxID=931172 RepID=A0AAV6VPM3_9ARAC|nr:hypothetical protein JTE90_006478 [Oedothorax gibbosus]